NAVQTGATVRTTLVGAPPQAVYGSPDHIHQLITTLAASLQDFARPDSIELQLSFGPQNGSSQMLISFLLSSATDNNLATRLTALTDAGASASSPRSADPELRLISAWQLALAVGADPRIATLSEHGVTLLVSMPLETKSSINPEVST